MSFGPLVSLTSKRKRSMLSQTNSLSIATVGTHIKAQWCKDSHVQNIFCSPSLWSTHKLRVHHKLIEVTNELSQSYSKSQNPKYKSKSNFLTYHMFLVWSQHKGPRTHPGGPAIAHSRYQPGTQSHRCHNPKSKCISKSGFITYWIFLIWLEFLVRGKRTYDSHKECSLHRSHKHILADRAQPT